MRKRAAKGGNLPHTLPFSHRSSVILGTILLERPLRGVFIGQRWTRRSWSDDEKPEICQQMMVPGVSVAQVARRYKTAFAGRKAAIKSGPHMSAPWLMQ